MAPIFWGDLLKHGYKAGESMLDHFEGITVTGNCYLLNDGKIAMGIDWMTKKDYLKQYRRLIPNGLENNY